MDEELKEAQEFIKKWGVDSDNYIMENLEQFMTAGDPDDNSCGLHDTHQQMLKIVVDAGLKAKSA